MIEHAAIGTGRLCRKCFQPTRLHRKPRVRVDNRVRERSYVARDRKIIGIDGEGFDLPDGNHIYTLLCAVNEDGVVVGEVENQKGLSSKECFDMLLGLPRDTLKFIFMGSYDWTKMIEDLDDIDKYYIMHPEARRRYTCKTCKFKWINYAKVCPRCQSPTFRSHIRHRQVGEYKLDWFNGSFTVAHIKNKRQRTKVWDCFKFFQSSFVKAIEAWSIGTKEVQERILAMKNKRGSFSEEKPEDVRMYCREECQLLAQMMRKLISACMKADINLQRYDGAGAIANAMLRKNEVKRYIGPPLEDQPDGLYHAVMAAYFGGRFENSVVGFIEQKVYNRDIFSAYPYAISLLPCLECGTWKRVVKDVLETARKSTLSVVKYRIKIIDCDEREGIAWMPFPFRDEKGSICFPSGSVGWAWLPELEAGLKGWEKYIEIEEAWCYTTECEHRPFEWMPAYYRKRIEWGKDGPGIVMKLGCNACAGKTMQNAGDKPPFKSWIWGGMITATTRAQDLDAICMASNRWNVLAIATDGVFSTEFLDMPRAKDTGTSDLKKPLGDWGCDVYENGIFFVKPGLYFDEAKSLMRARGIGRQELDKIGRIIIDSFKTWDRKGDLQITAQSRRFYGAKSSVLMQSGCVECDVRWPGWPSKGCPKCGESGDMAKTAKMEMSVKKNGKNVPSGIAGYGRWDVRTINIEFACLPKREYIHTGGTFGRMRIRDMGGKESTPYLGVTSPEGLAARAATELALEESDWSDGQEEIVE